MQGCTHWIVIFCCVRRKARDTKLNFENKFKKFATDFGFNYGMIIMLSNRATLIYLLNATIFARNYCQTGTSNLWFRFTVWRALRRTQQFITIQWVQPCTQQIPYRIQVFYKFSTNVKSCSPRMIKWWKHVLTESASQALCDSAIAL